MDTSQSTSSPLPPKDEKPASRVMPVPADTNQYGDIFGGWIMSHADLAGATCAALRSRSRVATVAVTSFVFKEPVNVGDLVSFYGTIAKVGTTSITVDVEVFSERIRENKNEIVKVTEAQIVYVALDAQGRPHPIDREPTSASNSRIQHILPTLRRVVPPKQSKEKNLVLSLPKDKPALRLMPMPADTNEFGDVFAGWVMSQCDLAAAVPALLEAQSRVATVAVTNFTFKEPVYVGDVVSFYSRILKVGVTSITVDVDVYAERLLKDNYNIVHVTEAQLVYVALDANGRKQKVNRPGKVQLPKAIDPELKPADMAGKPLS